MWRSSLALPTQSNFGVPRPLTAYISGGTSGINLAIARAIAGQGGKVLVFGRDAAKAKGAAEGIERDFQASAMHGSADVRDPGAIARLFSEAVSQIGAPDLIVAGAAGNFMARAAQLSPNGFKSVIDIDLLGTFNVFRTGVDLIKRPGSMIAITAPQAAQPTPQQVHVCAAKAGVNMVVKVLALEWGSAGIRVNGISPGPIEGTEGMARLAPTDADRRAWTERTALRRFGQADEIAQAVLFLTSEAGAYITGTILDCDGGMSLGNTAGEWL